jgi:hypothetical protein
LVFDGGDSGLIINKGSSGILEHVVGIVAKDSNISVGLSDLLAQSFTDANLWFLSTEPII